MCVKVKVVSYASEMYILARFLIVFSYGFIVTFVVCSVSYKEEHEKSVIMETFFQLLNIF